MATDEELKKDPEEESGDDDAEAEADDQAEAEAEAAPDAEAEAGAEKEEQEDEGSKLEKTGQDEEEEEEDDEDDEDVATPAQLGFRRYVYAAYLAAAVTTAFLLTKALDYAWFKLATWKPEWFGTIGVEPRDEILVPLCAAIGIFLAIYYWRKTKVRTLIEEVAEELTKVTWPTRQEVTSSTTVVIIATAFSTAFFALMDQFWLWLTKHVYGS